ncbi:X-linked retinitis pigmentosa GTPase regulator-interacting protein 1 [Pleurodeles waltl]|uniref:X-linked retinitis pigmentosa GTPase regulator-interacting protein 1 n=1 Tax=Pleurodeles waltl TaxID=8319 RepID=UPI003709A5A8
MSVNLMEESAEDLPVRDTDSKVTVIRAIQDVSVSPVPPKHLRTVTMKEKDAKVRQRVGRVSREELEDRFFQLSEENLLLKDHARKQESKIKRMGTKLLRLVSERKSGGPGAPARGSQWLGRDLATEEAVEQLQEEVRELERRNEALRHRLAACTRQLQVQASCRHCPYGNVPPRTDSGLRAHGTESHVPEKAKRGLRVQGPVMRTSHTAPARYGEQLLGEDARAEIERLARVVQSQNARMAELEHSSTSQKDSTASTMRAVDQQAEDHRATIKDNVGQIRLQRQLWEKDTALRLLKEEYQQMQETYEAQFQEKQETLQVAHNTLLAQVEDLSTKLKSEQMKVVVLNGQLKNMSILQRSLDEFQGQVSDLEKERDLLKDNYDTLLKSTLSLENQCSWKSMEEQLRREIMHLQEQLKAELSAKRELQENLEREGGRNEELKKEVSWMQLQLLEQKQETLLLQRKVDAILSSSPSNRLPSEPRYTPNLLQSHITDGLWRLGIPQAAWEEKMEAKKKTDEKTQTEKAGGAWIDNPARELCKMEIGHMEISRKNFNEMEVGHMETSGKNLYETEVGHVETSGMRLCEMEMGHMDTSGKKLYEKEVGHIESSEKKLHVLEVSQEENPVTRWQKMKERPLENPTKKLQDMEADHAETILELEKTRDMLILQHKINKDYQDELEAVMLKAEQEKKIHEENDLKAAHLLDMRGARIQRLEGQLKDIAYGTSHLPFRPPLAPDDDNTMAEVPTLRRGENLFELHIHQLHLTPEALRQVGDPQPAIFCTYSFYDFETHATPVMSGQRLVFGFTSQYVVQLDEPFLQYLQCASARLDVHLAEATDHRILAACLLKFGQVLDSEDCVHGTAELNGPNGEDFGMLEYRVRLRFPIPQTLRLQRERTKALGYMSANVQSHWGSPHSQHKPETFQVWGAPASGVQKNELVVRLEGCSGVRSCWLGSQPSPYAIYRFFDFPDHDTPIVPYSNNPYFGDNITFPVPVTSDLDNYLRLHSLWVYIFDDEDTEPGCYLGKAQVPLLSLARGQPIKGDFALIDSSGNPNGSVHLSLEWKFPYEPPGEPTVKGPRHVDSIDQRPLEALIEQERGLLQKEGGLRSGILAQAYGGDTEQRIATSGYRAKRASNIRKVTFYERKPNGGDNKKQSRTIATPGEPSASPQVKSHRKKMKVDTVREAEEETMRVPRRLDAPAGVSVLAQQSSAHAATPHAKHQHYSVGRSAKGVTKECVTTKDIDLALDQKPLPLKFRVIAVHPRLEARKQHEQMVVLQGEELRGELSVVGQSFGPEEADSAHLSEGSELASDVSESLSTDSDDVLVVARPRKMPKPLSDRIRIEIGSLSLDPLSDVAADSRVQRVYVEYRFLDLPLEETETPVSLRKPTAGEEIHFNFSKVIHVDWGDNKGRRDCLYGMLEGLDGDGEEGRLKFTVVSEPMNELQDECEEVGYAYLDLRQILLTGSDVMEQNLHIFNVPEQDTVIGTLTVSVEAVEAMRAVYWERRDPVGLMRGPGKASI